MIKEKKKIIEDIISVYDVYIDLLEKEIDSLISLAVAHGYTGNEESYHKGVELRGKIKNLKREVLA